MILDDLLIYGDWLEENDIKNDVYKQFLNLLRIKLRENDEYLLFYRMIKEDGNGFGHGNLKCKYYLASSNTRGYGVIDGDGYGCGILINYKRYSYGGLDGSGIGINDWAFDVSGDGVGEQEPSGDRRINYCYF